MPTIGSTLIKAAAQRRDLRKLLDAGVCTSIGEIGDAEKISKSCVSRILRLALLAPSIVEKILDEPADHALMLETGAAAAGELGGAASQDLLMTIFIASESSQERWLALDGSPVRR